MVQAVRPGSLCKHGSGEVALPGIRQQSYDCFSFVFRTLCQFYGRPDGGSGRDSHQHAFLPSDASSVRKGVLIGNGQNFIIDFGIQVVRHKTRANSLDLVCAGNSAREDWGRRWLHSHDLYGGIFAFEVFAHAANRTACPYAGNKNVYFSVCIRPNLRASRCAVGGRVYGVYISFASSSALAIAPFIPFAPSVNTSSAPYALMS